MRMWRLSASRQPCSAGLVHRGDQEFVVRAEGDGEMRAGPGQEFRRGRHVGKPQRRTVVVRDREPQALRRKRKPTNGRGHLDRLLLGLAALDEGGLAGRPGEGAVRMQRQLSLPVSTMSQ